MPNLFYDSQSATIYIDMAGLFASNGDIIGLINWLIYKHIFNLVHSYHLLILIPVGEIFDAKGNSMVQQIQLLKQMFHTDLDKVINSMFPIVTKCKPRHFQNDIDLIRSTVEKCLINRMN